MTLEDYIAANKRPPEPTRYTDIPEAQAWLDRCLGTTFAHGSALVEALKCAGNVYIADRCLEWWESQGVIERTGPATPTASQQFMGHGGMWWCDMKRRPALHPPCFFGWRPK